MLQRMGARPTYRFTVDGVDTVLCGISVVDRKKMVAGEVLTEGYLVMDSLDLALNINTAEDLRAAEKRLSGRTEDRRDKA